MHKFLTLSLALVATAASLSAPIYDDLAAKHHCLVEVTDVRTYGAAFGVYEYINGAGKFFGIRRNGTQEAWSALWGGPSHTLYLYTLYEIHYEYGSKACRINEATGTSNTTVEYSKPLFIFALNQLDGNRPNGYNYMRLYSFSITRSGEKILDLTPVRFLNENNKWEGAMYDTVSDSLFRNQGTGSFIIGPDL